MLPDSIGHVNKQLVPIQASGSGTCEKLLMVVTAYLGMASGNAGAAAGILAKAAAGKVPEAWAGSAAGPAEGAAWHGMTTSSA